MKKNLLWVIAAIILCGLSGFKHDKRCGLV